MNGNKTDKEFAELIRSSLNTSLEADEISVSEELITRTLAAVRAAGMEQETGAAESESADAAGSMQKAESAAESEETQLQSENGKISGKNGQKSEFKIGKHGAFNWKIFAGIAAAAVIGIAGIRVVSSGVLFSKTSDVANDSAFFYDAESSLDTSSLEMSELYDTSESGSAASAEFYVSNDVTDSADEILDGDDSEIYVGNSLKEGTVSDSAAAAGGAYDLPDNSEISWGTTAYYVTEELFDELIVYLDGERLKYLDMDGIAENAAENSAEAGAEDAAENSAAAGEENAVETDEEEGYESVPLVLFIYIDEAVPETKNMIYIYTDKCMYGSTESEYPEEVSPEAPEFESFGLEDGAAVAAEAESLVN